MRSHREVAGGETKVVRFNGVNAIRIPLRGNVEMLPPPRPLPEKQSQP